jgi:protein-L-isoaspartate(D-aspartate) O-methyltransferase
MKAMQKGEKKDRFVGVRERMLKWDLAGRDITDPAVLKVMEQVRREEFVPRAYQWQAYADGPLPIGMGQTISQPYIVALMTQELRLNPDCEVLEVGTGSGYQTAVLARLVKKVYTIERFAELSESAQAVLAKLGVKNVEFYIGDGSCGWPQKRTFDRIMVTAGVPNVPGPLADQLADGGIIVTPVGAGAVQQLIACEKKKQKLVERVICGCRFVKLFGEYGFDETED